MKDESILIAEESKELEDFDGSHLINKPNSELDQKQGLPYLQSIIDLEGLRSFQYLTGLALGMAFLLYGILSYEFNFIYPSLKSALHLSGWQKAFINTSFSFGDIIGAFASQYLSKQFGRRNSILYFSAVLMVVSFIVSAFTNIWWLSFCRFISGFSIAINYCLIIPILTESIPTTSREIFTIGFFSFFRIGIILYVLFDKLFIIPDDNILVYLTRKNDQWKDALYLPAMISILLFITNSFIVKETPRYLFLNAKYEEGIGAVKEIYSRQSENIQEDRLKMEAVLFAEEAKIETSFVDLFSENFLRLSLLTSIIMLCSNICNTSNMYSLPLILNYDISKYWKYIILQQSVALVAHLPVGIMAHNVYIGRKYTILIGFSGSAIISIVTFSFSKGILISSPLLNFFLIFFSAVTKLYIAEAFPTKLRVRAISLSYSIARVGDFISFILCDWTHSLFNYGPLLVIFVSSLIGGTCALLLRVETSNRALDTKFN